MPEFDLAWGKALSFAGDYDRSGATSWKGTHPPGGREIQPHPAWCWSPHGVFDTHLPDRWTRVVFSEQRVGEA